MANVISRGQLVPLSRPSGLSTLPRDPFLLPADVTTFRGVVEAMGAETVNPLTVWSTQPSVRKVVDFAARAVASTPLKVYRRVNDTDRQRVTDHPLARVLAAPSAGMIPYRFWHSIVVDWLLYDKWLVAKTANLDATRPVELVRIQAERVAFADDGLGRVAAIYVDGRFRPELKVADCLFDHGYSPLSADGTSPMRTLAAILQESREAVAYRRSIWANSARVPVVLQRPADAPQWSDGARDNFLAGWRKYVRGGGREGGTPILQDGMTLAKVDAFTPKDTLDIEGRQLTDAEVASAFHIAPELVGARQGTYSNVQAFREMLYGPALGPLFIAWEQVVNTMLTPDLDDTGELYVEADVDSKLRGSFNEQAALLSTSIGRPWMTAAEGRARVNLPDIGGDSHGLVTPLNVLTGGQASPRDTGAQNLNSRRSVAFKARAPDTYEQKATEILAGFFKRQSRVVLGALGVKADGWWDAARWDGELSDDLFRLASLVAADVGAKTAEQLGFTGDAYDVGRTLHFLRAVADSDAASINATTRAQIDEALASEDPAATPAAVFDIAAAVRVASIAVSAVSSASGFATVEAARQQSGGNATKTWETGPNARPEHAALDGQTVGIDEPFSDGSNWPGGLPGCNCGISVNVT